MPFTTAQTSGPGATSLLQDARVQASTIGRIERHSFNWRSFGGKKSSSFFDAARPNARGAHADVFPRAIHDGLHTPKVRIPAPPPRIVRMADHVAVRGLLATDFTGQCHIRITPGSGIRVNEAPMLAEKGEAEKRFGFMVMSQFEFSTRSRKFKLTQHGVHSCRIAPDSGVAAFRLHGHVDWVDCRSLDRQSR